MIYIFYTCSKLYEQKQLFTTKVAISIPLLIITNKPQTMISLSNKNKMSDKNASLFKFKYWIQHKFK